MNDDPEIWRHPDPEIRPVRKHEDVVCPTCGAEIGEQCQHNATREGGATWPTTTKHRARVRASRKSGRDR